MSQPINFEALKDDYNSLWQTMSIEPSKLPLVQAAARTLRSLKPRYDEVLAAVKKVAPVSIIPWQFVALVHKMECNLSFNHHLYNGDPLTARTVQVPAGRPTTGNPPFTFVQSAVDALIFQGLTAEFDFSIPKMLFRLEGYNGFGYRQYHNINTPYLWSFTNHYKSGKYVSDGKYDPTAVSDQVGSAAILKLIL